MNKLLISGGTMYDGSGVECTITPHSSSNQIFVVVDMSVGLNNFGYGGTKMILRRDSTDLINFRGKCTHWNPSDCIVGEVTNDFIMIIKVLVLKVILITTYCEKKNGHVYLINHNAYIQWINVFTSTK